MNKGYIYNVITIIIIYLSLLLLSHCSLLLLLLLSHCSPLLLLLLLLSHCSLLLLLLLLSHCSLFLLLLLLSHCSLLLLLSHCSLLLLLPLSLSLPFHLKYRPHVIQPYLVYGKAWPEAHVLIFLVCFVELLSNSES